MNGFSCIPEGIMHSCHYLFYCRNCPRWVHLAPVSSEHVPISVWRCLILNSWKEFRFIFYWLRLSPSSQEPWFLLLVDGIYTLRLGSWIWPFWQTSLSLYRVGLLAAVIFHSFPSSSFCLVDLFLQSVRCLDIRHHSNSYSTTAHIFIFILCSSKLLLNIYCSDNSSTVNQNLCLA